MKKQVTFSESQMVHGLLQEETLPRRNGMSDSKMALNFNEPAKRCRPQLQDVITVQIPKTMTTAPFLKHTALTPAQREFLYTIAASYSTAHVRHLINQHYMNVLHRCITPGHDTRRDNVPSPIQQPSSEGSSKHGSVSQSPAKHKEKINRGARNSGKSPLPKAPSRQTRFLNSSTSKQRKTEKNTKSASLRRKSPKSGRLKLQQQKEEEDDSLSECMSSLFMEELDDDTFLKL